MLVVCLFMMFCVECICFLCLLVLRCLCCLVSVCVGLCWFGLVVVVAFCVEFSVGCCLVGLL